MPTAVALAHVLQLVSVMKTPAQSGNRFPLPSFVLVCATIVVVVAAPVPAAAQATESRLIAEESGLDVGPIQVSPLGVVKGEVVNRTGTTVRDVRVLIRYEWLWADEFDPGPIEENPARSYFFTVPAEIEPGETATFTYEPGTPLTSREGGEFLTRVEVVGWVEVGR